MNKRGDALSSIPCKNTAAGRYLTPARPFWHLVPDHIICNFRTNWSGSQSAMTKNLWRRRADWSPILAVWRVRCHHNPTIYILPVPLFGEAWRQPLYTVANTLSFIWWRMAGLERRKRITCSTFSISTSINFPVWTGIQLMSPSVEPTIRYRFLIWIGAFIQSGDTSFLDVRNSLRIGKVSIQHSPPRPCHWMLYIGQFLYIRSVVLTINTKAIHMFISSIDCNSTHSKEVYL